jgi:hypothetical protein
MPVPAPQVRGLSRQSVQRLQGAAGNAAVSRLVAQRYTAPVKPSPAQAAGFRKVKADVAAKKSRVAVHPPAAGRGRHDGLEDADDQAARPGERAVRT